MREESWSGRKDTLNAPKCLTPKKLWRFDRKRSTYQSTRSPPHVARPDRLTLMTSISRRWVPPSVHTVAASRPPLLHCPIVRRPGRSCGLRAQMARNLRRPLDANCPILASKHGWTLQSGCLCAGTVTLKLQSSLFCSRRVLSNQSHRAISLCYGLRNGASIADLTCAVCL